MILFLLLFLLVVVVVVVVAAAAVVPFVFMAKTPKDLDFTANVWEPNVVGERGRKT